MDIHMYLCTNVCVCIHEWYVSLYQQSINKKTQNILRQTSLGVIFSVISLLLCWENRTISSHLFVSCVHNETVMSM